jgi:protein SSD1
MGQFSNLNMNLGLDSSSQAVPRGHGRRHSVNVVKPGGQVAGNASVSYGSPYSQDGFEDGFITPTANFGGHSRQVSRAADSSWRISESKYDVPHSTI